MASVHMNQASGTNPEALPVHSLLTWVQAAQPVESGPDMPIWWPSLVFDNKKHLYQYLKCDVELKSVIYLELHRHDPRGRGKVAFLLGRHRPRNVQTILVPAENESVLLKDFFDNVDEMDEAYGHDANWREAYDEARNRLLSSQQDLRVNNCEATLGCIQASSMDASIDQAPMVNIETSHEMPIDTEIVNAVLALPSSTLPVPSMETATVPGLHDDLQVDQKVASTVPASEQNEPTKAAKSVKKMRQLTPSPKAHNLSNVNKEMRATCESKKKRSIPKFAPWSLIWQILSEDYGYSQRKGTGVVKLYYLTPQFQNQSLEYIRKHGHLERDYFSSEEALQRHVKEKFDWKGENDKADQNQSNSKTVGRKRKEEDKVKSSNKKSSNRDDEGNLSDIKILSDQEAWKRLSSTKYGFKEIKPYYCLPDVDPKSSSFKLGYHYFRDLNTLRRNLCAYGIPDPKKHILEDHDLRTWLRLAVFTQVQGLKSIPSYEPLYGFTKAWNVLQKIGFKWCSTGYTFPNKELSFENAYDMLYHLSRFGLPKSAALENVDRETLLALELHIADFEEEKRNSWKRLPCSEEDEKWIKKDHCLDSRDTKTAVKPSSSRKDLSAHQETEESETDSRFSRSSSPMKEQHDARISDKGKGKRAVTKISGFDVSKDDVARAKKASRKNSSQKIHASSVHKIPPKSLSNVSSDLSFPADESDSPFSKGSSFASGTQEPVVLETFTKRPTTKAHAKSDGAKSSKIYSKQNDRLKASAGNAKGRLATRDTERDSSELSEYEKIRAMNIERNNNRLRSLGLLKETETASNKATKATLKKSPNEAAQIQKVENKIVPSVSSKRLNESSTKKKVTETSDEESVGSYSILSDEEAWARLTMDKFGFTLRNNEFFCLPGVDPSENRFREGYDYFRDLNSLRKNLCAFGIPDPNQTILEDEELSNWICLSISTAVHGLNAVPSYEPLRNFAAAWSILSKIGFKYSASVYHLPNKERAFKDAYDIWCYLSRFGIPTTASPQKIDAKTLLALELFLSDCPSDKRKLWHRLSDDADVSQDDSKSRRNPLDKAISKSTEVLPDEQMKSAAMKSPQSFSVSSNLMDCDDSLGSLESVVPPTIGDELQRLVKALSPAVLTDQNVFLGSEASSEFSKQRGKVLDFLRVSIKNYQTGKKSVSSSLYICGGPGTGKTTTVNDCIKLVSSECQASSGLAPIHLSINGANIQSSSSFLSDIADVLDEKSVDKIGNRLKNLTCPLILVVDEIDLIIRQLFGSKGDMNISNIFSWASESDYKFILIGISNSVGNKDAKKIMDKFDDEVVFQPYSEDDMVAIIEKRLGSARSLVETSAVKFAAKKASKVSGDIRQVLNIIQLAFTKCLDELSSEVLSKTVDGNAWVKLRHVMVALKDSGAVPLAHIISHLPQSGKSVLCIAVALQSYIPPRSSLTLGMLKKYCAEASSHNVVTLENTSNEVYVDIVRQLEDAGLLSIGGSDIFFNGMNSDPSQMQLSIQCGMDDVECAMGESLFNQPFYKNLFDYVRKTWQ